MAEPIQVADPYRALGVGRSATDTEIKAAHRKLAKRFHPDADGGDTRRFLRVQEAYRVLSDPLLRREWDARHAPGPVRADRAAARPTRQRPARTPRPAAAQAEPAETPPQADREPRAQPRSSRAYTWSAGDVPWWEDAGRATRRRAHRTAPEPAPDAERQPAPEPDAEPANEFDVYNRSSGAAWSMAARAYFRRGEQDLPRRGSYHHEGSQPLTAARARTAAENEARRRAAAAHGQSTPPPRQAASSASRPAAAAPPPTAAPTAQQARDGIVRRAIAARAWPTVAQRLTYAFIAWLPFASLIVLAATVAPVDEAIQAMLLALTLAVLFFAPRLAYVAGAATLGLLAVGALLIGALAVLGVPLPLNMGVTAVLGAALALGYVATAGMVALGPSSLRPWTRDAESVRSQ